MKRRALIQLGAGAIGASLAVSRLLSSSASPRAYAAGSRRVLVWLELRGGNDGLNTVIPHRDPAYRLARPRLALSEGLVLTPDLLLHPSLGPLHAAWTQRRLAFALGVGWSNPNRSHFKATDQWAVANPSGEGPGWLAQALIRQHRQGPLVALGPSGTTAIEGTPLLALQISPAQLQRQNGPPLEPSLAADNPILRRMLEVEASGQQATAELRRNLPPVPAGLVIPPGSLGQQVALALRLISSPNPPPVIQMSHGGFDTHANQLIHHSRELKVVGEALAAFDAGLQRLPQRGPVVLLATSEFGRRLQQNGSGGTDHGGASIAILLGDRLPQPFLGSYPSLSQLDERGDLVASLTPPQLYEYVLNLHEPRSVH
jgi:uncharacterized protein (DUF1501 family)